MVAETMKAEACWLTASNELSKRAPESYITCKECCNGEGFYDLAANAMSSTIKGCSRVPTLGSPLACPICRTPQTSPRSGGWGGADDPAGSQYKYQRPRGVDEPTRMAPTNATSCICQSPVAVIRRPSSVVPARIVNPRNRGPEVRSRPPGR